MTLRGDLRVNHRRIGEWWATRQPGTVDVHHYRWGVRVDGDWVYGELAHREADGAAVLAAKVLAASRAIPDADALTEDEVAYAIAGVYGESCGWGANRGRECGMCDCLGMTEAYARSAARAVLAIIVAAVLKPIRELHAAGEPVCVETGHTPSRCPCSEVFCEGCGESMPCPTVRLLDEIEAAAKGGA